MRTRSMILAAVIAVGCGASLNPTGTDHDPVREATVLEKRLSESSGSFGLTLFRRISAAEPGVNQFISPVSVSLALGMTLNGASGTTYDAMKGTLRLNGLSEQDINESYQSLVGLLLSTDPDVTMDIANSVWHRNTFAVEQSFRDALVRWYSARIEGLDFSSSAAPVAINGWVSEATRGKIDRIVPDQIPASMVMYLINAIYFKGTWTTRFDPDRTRDRTFTLSDGSRKMVPFMTLKDTVLAGEIDGTQVLELTYGNGNYRMTFLLPPTGTTVDDFIAGLTDENWARYLNAVEETSIDIYVPKFRMKYERTLNDDLTAMGMGIAFTDGADFSRINPSFPLAISEVKHKTFIQVDEEGTEAAAVTSIGIVVTSVPVSLDIDRPFVFAVRDANSGAIVFIGKIMEPVWE